MASYPIIELNDVSMQWDRQRVLDDVTLTINRGDFLAVTGPNGGGKSTLLRVILKLIKPTTGSVKYFTEQHTEAARLSIGYLPQKNMIDSRFPITVSEVIEMGMIGERSMPREEKARLVDEMIRTVGLENERDSSMGALSGGQMQRALLGRALVSRPEVLVLDEPLSYLDRYFEARMYKIISGLPRETTVVLVSHDVSKIATMANRHIIVDHGIEICHSANHFAHYYCCNHPEHRHEDIPEQQTEL